MTFHLPKAQPSSISKLLHTDFTKASRHSGSNRVLSPKSLPAHAGQYRAVDSHHRAAGRQRQHRADSGAQTRVTLQYYKVQQQPLRSCRCSRIGGSSVARQASMETGKPARVRPELPARNSSNGWPSACRTWPNPTPPSTCAPLNQPDQATFYGGGAKGYTDYPTLSNS